MFACEFLRRVFKPRRYSASAISANLAMIEGELALYDALLHSALRQLSDIRVLVLDLRKRLGSADVRASRTACPSYGPPSTTADARAYEPIEPPGVSP